MMSTTGELLEPEALDTLPMEELIKSGRWLKRVVPTGNGSDHIHIATYYGISGANKGGIKHEKMRGCSEPHSVG